MIYAVGIVASISSNIKTNNVIHSVLIYASNDYEADGKAMAIALKLFPTLHGWRNHCVKTCSKVVDPETVEWLDGYNPKDNLL